MPPPGKTGKKMDECPVYHPSIEEFQDPILFVQKIASEASKFGICKVVCPLNVSKPAGSVLQKSFRFGTDRQPLRLGKWDKHDYINFFESKRFYNLRDFEIMANKEAARRFSMSGCLPAAYLEKEFWDEMNQVRKGKGKKGFVEYAINIESSAFSSPPDDPLSASKWNLKELPRVDGCALRLLDHEIPGVTRPMLYIGMLFSMFAWHVEDQYLYSINYHHCGAPKTWYGVPSSAASQLESFFQNHVYSPEIMTSDSEDGAFTVLADKTTMYPPSVLLQHGIPVCKTVQMPGEFVITFPRAYHSGFSHGFNCGEAVNFAANDWYKFGMESSHRYALLGRMPVIPYEELICKNAMLLSQTSNHLTRSNQDLASICSLKVAFVFLLKLHHSARRRIRELRPSLNLQTISEGTILCTLCCRDCFVGHYSCKCRANPICLFHERRIYNCLCGSSSNMIIRQDMPEMEDVAQMFYQEDGIHCEVESQIKRVSYSWDSTNINLVQDGYQPFSEMKRTKKRRSGPVVETTKIIWRFSRVCNKRAVKKKRLDELSKEKEEKDDFDIPLSSFINTLRVAA